MPTLLEALEFYAEQDNWHSVSTGFALQYDPVPSAIRTDWGAKAREALAEYRAQFPAAWQGHPISAPDWERLKAVHDNEQRPLCACYGQLPHAQHAKTITAPKHCTCGQSFRRKGPWHDEACAKWRSIDHELG